MMQTPMQAWLIEAATAAELQQLRESGVKATSEQQAMFSRVEAETTPAILSRSGNVAQISIAGVLTKRPDVWLSFFGSGNTAYEHIQRALQLSADDPSIERVQLLVDSPGGSVDGLFETLSQLQSYSKPLSVKAAFATSAAYAIAAAAGSIEAQGPASTFGSIGVAVQYYVRNSTVDITSTAAPDKRPDVTTPEGKATVRAHLDQVHTLFAEAIATGRQTTSDRVNSDFGRGGLVLARDAKLRGMIDSIAGAVPERTEPTQSSTASNAAAQPPGGTMNLKELKTEHPAIYEAAVSEGVAQERDRVAAHLTYGRLNALSMKTALAAIENGDGMTMALQAKYLTADRNERDLQARAGDEHLAASALDGATSKPAASGADAVADALDRQLNGAVL